MKRVYFLILFFIVTLEVNAGFDPTAKGGRSASMAYNSVTSNDFWSVFNNQAGMAWDAKLAVGAFFENRYFVKEMSTRGLGITIPVAKNDVFGLSFSQYGYSAYNETKVGISYAKVFANRVAAGLQMDYLRVASTTENGTKGIFTFEAGLQSKVSKKMTIGVFAFNPIHTILSDYNGYNEYVPVVLKFGLSYKFSEKFTLLSEAEKDLHFDPILRVGGDFKLNDHFFIRGGMSTGVVQYSIGVGTVWNGFTFDIASSFHQVLGVTPTVSLNYNFKMTKKSTSSL